MAGQRKVHTAEFKLQAVKMITEQKFSVAEAARRLGVSESLLHCWKKAFRRVRRHSSLRFLSPVDYERTYKPKLR